MAGAAIGLATAWASASALSSLLFGMQPREPIAYVGPLAVLLAVGAAATFIPALRASPVDPLIALRRD